MIGGSFALAARRAGIAERITGWDSREVLDEARARGVIDDAERSFSNGGSCEADLVYVAAPVGGILSFIGTQWSSFKSGAIVTDAGSTKREICRVAREALAKNVRFVGGHPMAGSHNAGIEYASADLFRGAPYALIADDTRSESSSAFRLVEEVIRAIGAIPVALTAEEHDQIVARVSHAPQLIATALACVVARRRNETDLRLAGSGFSEMVRLAASRWSVWEDICRTNADEIALALDEVIGEIEAARSSIVIGDFDGISTAFEQANSLSGSCSLAGRNHSLAEED